MNIKSNLDKQLDEIYGHSDDVHLNFYHLVYLIDNLINEYS